MPDPLFLDSRIAAVLAPQGPRNGSRKDERHGAGAGVRGFWSEAKKPGGHKTLRPWGVLEHPHQRDGEVKRRARASQSLDQQGSVKAEEACLSMAATNQHNSDWTR